MSDTAPFPTIDDIRQAADRIAPYTHRTPVMTCQGLDRITSARLYFKCESLQKVGAFKIRGATNAVISLAEAEARRGVATHSSGNHAAALALAARQRGIPAFIVMPGNAPRVKRQAVAGYGAEIIQCAATLEAREQTLHEVVERTGAHFVPPYNDYRVIAGQATATLELLEDVPELDMVITPVGGGGLTSGASLAVHYLSPRTKMIGAEPAGADDAYRSFHSDRLVPVDDPDTIADGLRTSLGDKTFAIIRAHVDDIVTVDDEMIIRAMRLIWERMKLVVEPSAAVPFAALLAERLDIKGCRIGIILSGGNVDLDHLPWCR